MVLYLDVERGCLNEDGVYVSRRLEFKHYFRKFNGYGISLKLLNSLGSGRKVCLLVKGEVGVITSLYAFVEDFLNYGIKWTDFSQKEEDVQMILPMEYFNQPRLS